MLGSILVLNAGSQERKDNIRVSKDVLTESVPERLGGFDTTELSNAIKRLPKNKKTS